jgi:endonuclease-3 related protein
MEMFGKMSDHFGPQHWWPADTELEMMVGAVLTQNTNWGNVERAMSRLKKEKRLTVRGLASLPVERLADLIRPAGYYNIKAGRLKNLIRFIVDRYGGDLTALLEEETGTLRQGLLSVNGVGPETADSILLYAAHRPVFVVDAYTHRILERHGLIGDTSDYHALQALFMDALAGDEALYGELHALIVRTGKAYCRRSPLCRGCPLEQWGPVSPLRR